MHRRETSREGKWSKGPLKIKKRAKDQPFQPVNLDRYIGNWIFLNITYDHFGNEIINRNPNQDLELDDEDTDEEVVSTSCVSSSLVPTMSTRKVSDCFSVNDIFYPSSLTIPFSINSPVQMLSSVEGNLFDYFVAAICPSCSFSYSQNPYLTLITPMSLEFAPLKSAVLAVSANQLRLLNNKRFEKEALYHKSMALSAVQGAIDAGKVDWGVIATVLMLCFYDISDGCNASWVTHLRGGLNLLDHISTSSTSSTYSMLQRFLRMYFVAHAIMSRTALEDDPIEQSYEWDEDDNLDEIDTSMGCSRALMLSIRETAVLASKISKIQQDRPLNHAEIATFSASCDTIERTIHGLRQTLPSCTNKPSELLQIAEVKRLCALLYLRERLGSIPNSTTTNNIPSTTLDAASIAYKSNLTANITCLLSTLPDSSTLLWPLFVLGNTQLDEEQRRFVSERLRSIEKVRNLGSVRQARLEVEEAWKRSDMGSDAKRYWGTRTGERPKLISLA
ncbi:hypothetical protein BP5796_07640 [Coleophoma crateriformis]|uniref:Uncharacterized protein n=1 Tax=Coleophoma crateriformis TaxID=565419 RepID=A0A3D8RJT5_9HELO|nr:hypothetical protein BP5796_07640 [Coleophoma crateriformis]